MRRLWWARVDARPLYGKGSADGFDVNSFEKTAGFSIRAIERAY